MLSGALPVLTGTVLFQNHAQWCSARGYQPPASRPLNVFEGLLFACLSKQGVLVHHHIMSEVIGYRSPDRSHSGWRNLAYTTRQSCSLVIVFGLFFIFSAGVSTHS